MVKEGSVPATVVNQSVIVMQRGENTVDEHAKLRSCWTVVFPSFFFYLLKKIVVHLNKLVSSSRKNQPAPQAYSAFLSSLNALKN